MISGWAEAESGVSKIIVGGKIKNYNNQVQLYFNHLVSVPMGSSEITLKVIDRAGNEQSYKQKIQRSNPSHLDYNERLVLALFPLNCDKSTGKKCQSIQSLYTGMDDQLRAKRRFQMVERQKLSSHLDKLKLCELTVSDKCAWEVAQLTAAQGLVIGEMIERDRNGNSSVEAYSRVINGMTGEILMAFDGYQEQGNQQQLEEILSNKLHQKFPLVTFTDIKVKGSKVAINGNNVVQIWQKMPIKIFDDNNKACAIGQVKKVMSNKATVSIKNRCIPPYHISPASSCP